MKTMATQIKSKALFSDDSEHRLLLRREWDKSKKSAMIIMINPNTADTLNIKNCNSRDIVFSNIHKIALMTE